MWLSRVRSMAGLSFARPLLPADVIGDPVLPAFTSWAQTCAVAQVPHVGS
jgi:hypothetical protein